MAGTICKRGPALMRPSPSGALMRGGSKAVGGGLVASGMRSCGGDCGFCAGGEGRS